MSTIVTTSNLKFTLNAAEFEHGLRQALAGKPDVIALQEAGPNRDPIIQRVGHELGYAWTRAKGGGAVMFKVTRYRLRACKPVRLARAEFVGHLVARKDRLPASICTEVLLDDLQADGPDGAVTVIEDYHLTAEVQMGAGYRKDLRHLLRVRRHKHEKRRLGRRSRMHKRRGRKVYPAGDGNFAGMTLGGFVSCWKNRKGGDLQGRPVSIVFADREAEDLDLVHTPSDHLTVVVTYK